MKTFVPKSGKEKNVCYIGYPGLTYDQLVDWTNDIVHNLRIKNRNRVVFPTVVLASEEVTDEFRKSMKFLEFRATGARLGNECPMMADGVLSASRGKTRIITDSELLRDRAGAEHHTQEDLADIITGKARKF
ncbi:MAG: hypothetical protein K6G90_10935 [Clostridia bacterium]|nr:hypothetical protein [Clostridia bacterium]